MKKWLLSGASTISIALHCYSQVGIAGPGVMLQDFNSLGTNASANLPASWKFSGAGMGNPASLNYDAATNFTTTNIQASSGSPATGGRYNWGNGGSTSDRAIGFLTTGSYPSPNAIMTSYRNETGSVIQGIDLSFDVERYRVNAAGFTLNFYYSEDGFAWTNIIDGNVSNSAFPAGASSYTFTNGLTVTKTVSLSGLNLPNGQVFYLMWTFVNAASANSQGLGLDNVSVSPVLSPSSLPVRLSGFAARNRLAAVELRWTSHDEMDIERYVVEKSSDGLNFNPLLAVLPTANDGGKAEYSASDGDPALLNFYRVKAIETTGTIVFSSIIRTDRREEKVSFSFFPNPVLGTWLRIRHFNLDRGDYSIEIFGLTGRRWLFKSVKHSGGYFQGEITLDDLPPGWYVLSVSGSHRLRAMFMRL